MSAFGRVGDSTGATQPHGRGRSIQAPPRRLSRRTRVMMGRLYTTPQTSRQVLMTSQVQRHPLAAQSSSAPPDAYPRGRMAAGPSPSRRDDPGRAARCRPLPTLREAIRELSGKGVLESRQGAGVFVTALDAAEDWDTVLRRATIVSVIEARIAIEAEAAALAATRRTPADMRAIRRTLAARGVVGQSVPDHVDADMAFPPHGDRRGPQRSADPVVRRLPAPATAGA